MPAYKAGILLYLCTLKALSNTAVTFCTCSRDGDGLWLRKKGQFGLTKLHDIMKDCWQCMMSAGMLGVANTGWSVH